MRGRQGRRPGSFSGAPPHAGRSPIPACHSTTPEKRRQAASGSAGMAVGWMPLPSGQASASGTARLVPRNSGRRPEAGKRSQAQAETLPRAPGAARPDRAGSASMHAMRRLPADRGAPYGPNSQRSCPWPAGAGNGPPTGQAFNPRGQAGASTARQPEPRWPCSARLPSLSERHGNDRGCQEPSREWHGGAGLFRRAAPRHRRSCRASLSRRAWAPSAPRPEPHRVTRLPRRGAVAAARRRRMP